MKANGEDFEDNEVDEVEEDDEEGEEERDGNEDDYEDEELRVRESRKMRRWITERMVIEVVGIGRWEGSYLLCEIIVSNFKMVKEMMKHGLVEAID